MHDFELEHEHDDMSEADRDAIARAIWEQDTVELRTVGIDIGSSTSHLLFARVTLKRQAQGLSSRFVVIDRQVIWRSPIMLTPFLADGTIDAQALEHFVQPRLSRCRVAPQRHRQRRRDPDRRGDQAEKCPRHRRDLRQGVGKIRLRHRRAQARKHPGGARLRRDRAVAAARRLRAACRRRRRHHQARADRQGRDRERRRLCGRRAAGRPGCRKARGPASTIPRSSWRSELGIATTPDAIGGRGDPPGDRPAAGDARRRSDRGRAAR